MTGAHDPGVEPLDLDARDPFLYCILLSSSFRSRISKIWNVLIDKRSSNIIKGSSTCPVGPAVFQPMTYAEASCLQLWTGVGMKTFFPKLPDTVSILGKSPVFPVIPESWGSSMNHSMLEQPRTKNKMKPMTWSNRSHVKLSTKYTSSPKNAILAIYNQGRILLYLKPLSSVPT